MTKSLDLIAPLSFNEMIMYDGKNVKFYTKCNVSQPRLFTHVDNGKSTCISNQTLLS